MRAWLLLLAVLATFQTFVQVASTEDITSKFITAISPAYKSENLQNSTKRKVNDLLIKEQTTIQSPITTALSKAFNPVIDLTSSSSSSASLSSLSVPSSATTSIPSLSSSSSSSLLSSSSRVAATGNLLSSAAMISTISNAEIVHRMPSKVLQYQYSDSDNIINHTHNTNTNNNNKLNNINNIEIDIKTIEDIDNTVVVTSEVNNNNNNNSEILKSSTPLLSTNELQQKQHIVNSLYNNNNININNNTTTNYSSNNNNNNKTELRTSSSSSSSSTTTTTTTTTTIIRKDNQLESVNIDNNMNNNSEYNKIESIDMHHTDHERNNQQRNNTNNADNLTHLQNKENEHHEDDGDSGTYSRKEIFGDKLKPDPSTLVEIENSLLTLFNMKRPPKIDRSKIIIPEAMRQLYEQMMGHEYDTVNIPKPGLLTKSANTVRSFTHQDSKIDDRFPHHHRFRLYFDISSIPGDEKLKAAEIQLTRDAISHSALNPRLANRTRYQVLAYDITRVGVRGKREPSYLLLDNKTIRLNSTDTISLDVQPAVNRWLATPKKNFGLLIEVRTMRSLKPAPHHHVRLRRSADEPHENWQHKQPLLFTYTDDGRHKSRSIRDVNTRSKRSGHHRRSYRRKNNEECRRHALYVDFVDVGWNNWIVAPPGYDAFYCHGRCPFPLTEHLNGTNHAVVQTLVNDMNPGKVPKACCVPTQLEGISMLYLNDQNTVVLKNYQEMSVVGCGCR